MTLIYIVAGEQSGDALGGRLIAALRAARPELEFAGVGGPQMAAAGLASLFPIQELAVMGLLEVLPRIRRIAGLLRQTEADIRTRRPDAVVTIDSPGFTLRLLNRLRDSGLKRVHYVAPQVWAWREGRVKHYPGLWDRLLCLLPFEPAFFAKHGLEARFVGHAVIESGVDSGDSARFRLKYRSCRRARHHTSWDWPVRPLIVTDLADKHDAYAAAAVALTKSGTSTLELALADVPMVVAYRVHPLTAWIVRRSVKVAYAAIVNLLLGRMAVPEFIQQDCTAAKLAAAVAGLLAGSQSPAQHAAFAEVRGLLTPATGTPSQAAAAEVLALLQS